MKDMLLAIWLYRHFIVSSIKNDLRSRFVRSKLGALWMILQPLAQVAIYALVLSQVLAAKLPGVNSSYAYPIYLMAGMLAWSLFSELVTRSMGMFVENGNLLKKMRFPRVCLPAIVVGSAVVNNLLLLLTMAFVFALLGHWPTFAILWLPLLMLVNVVFGMGLGLILGVMNVFVRDVMQVVSVILQLWFWMTPIVYMAQILPPAYQAYFRSNPMYPVVIGYQDVLLYGRSPDLSGIWPIAAAAVVMLVFSLVLFRRAAPEMVDVL
jgi:lipopolysaccharide transport system permease protein